MTLRRCAPSICRNADIARLLLDTCVLSEIRHPRGQPAVRAAVAALDDDEIFLSVITIGELTRGIALLDPGQRKTALGDWLAGLQRLYAPRILGIDAEIAQLWGTLTATAQRAGTRVSAADGLIAATAKRHGLTVMTRNVKDFAPTGVDLLNPWSETRP